MFNLPSMVFSQTLFCCSAFSRQCSNPHSVLYWRSGPSGLTCIQPQKCYN